MSEQRAPEYVMDKLDDGQEVHLSDGNSFYPSEVEFVSNGVILHNHPHTRVFKYTEMREIIDGDHSHYRLNGVTPE